MARPWTQGTAWLSASYPHASPCRRVGEKTFPHRCTPHQDSGCDKEPVPWLVPCCPHPEGQSCPGQQGAFCHPIFLTGRRKLALGDPSSGEQKLWNYMDIEVMKQWTAAIGSTQSQRQHEQLLGQVPFLAQSICWGKAMNYLRLFLFVCFYLTFI